MSEEAEVLFLVGHVEGVSWGIVGIYKTKEEAESKCTTWSHFVGPMVVGKDYIPGKSWPGAYYPMTEAAKKKGAKKHG